MFCTAGSCALVCGAGYSPGAPWPWSSACCPPTKPACPTWGNGAAMLGMLPCLARGAWEGRRAGGTGELGKGGEPEAGAPGPGSVAGSPEFLQASLEQEPLGAAVPGSPARGYSLPRPTAGIPCAELRASQRSAVTRLHCSCSQGFLPVPGTASQSLVGELIFLGPGTRCPLPISTCSSRPVPARAGSLVLTAVVPRGEQGATSVAQSSAEA